MAGKQFPSPGTDNVSGEISKHIFVPNEGYCLFINKIKKPISKHVNRINFRFNEPPRACLQEGRVTLASVLTLAGGQKIARLQGPSLLVIRHSYTLNERTNRRAEDRKVRWLPWLPTAVEFIGEVVTVHFTVTSQEDIDTFSGITLDLIF